MDIYTFYKTQSKDEIQQVCDRSSISPAYFQQLALGYCRPSVDLAYALELSSRGVMTFRELLPHSANMPKLRKTA